ncbi:MAG: hypothetical protein HQK79_22535 [Desulfobacterales bacterium]|nr:hypothetical protein [Desulfobacterales bacterium]MBF0396539.1 hypothetical protein [Desulfobacterales bacterium]
MENKDLTEDDLFSKEFDLDTYKIAPEEAQKIEGALESMINRLQKEDISDKEIDNFIETLFFS